jgi:SulP family sulfate permease
VVFSGLKKQVLDVMRHSGLIDYIGEENIFPDEEKALDTIYPELLEADPNAQCRLMKQHIGDTDGVKTWL